MSDPNDTHETPTALTYEGGFEAIVSRMQAREKPLSFATNEALAPLDTDLAELRKKLVEEVDPEHVTQFKQQSGNQRKSLELNTEFLGQPELCKLHGLLIAHLRKSDQPAHTMALFTRIWAEQADFMLQHLDPRWLVSAITTFGDHGQTEVQRRVGHSMSVLFVAMKLYESERLYSGFTPDNAFKLKRLASAPLPLNMDRYALVSGGLDVNMLGRLWLDSKKDDVIAPLAHHLLNLINADPGTVFRRFNTLRGRKLRQRAQKQSANDDPEPARAPAKAKSHSWGIVSTIKASPAQIKPFITHHLQLGAEMIDIYLDAPLPNADLARLTHPKVKITNCDRAYWEAMGKPVMEKHQQRQAFNATLAYRSSTLDWLAHIDCDEFIFGEADIISTLSTVPDTNDALIIPPAEEIAQSYDATDLLFRRTYFDAGCDKAIIDALYPTFGTYLRSGFISHTIGKTIARCGVEDVRFGVHLLKKRGIEVKNTQRSGHMTLLHRHAPDWDSFARHLDFRLSKGSYWDRGQARLGLGDIIDILKDEQGADGPRKLFDEVCAARPEVLKVLEEHAMLIRVKSFKALAGLVNE